MSRAAGPAQPQHCGAIGACEAGGGRLGWRWPARYPNATPKTRPGGAIAKMPATASVVLKKIGNLARRNVAGHTSSPAVCDFDRDGKPDLLVGSENGRIYFIKHDDCVSFPAEQIVARAPQELPAPRFPGLVSEGFVFNKAPHSECHASTPVETSRGMVAAWFGGTRGEAPRCRHLVELPRRRRLVEAASSGRTACSMRACAIRAGTRCSTSHLAMGRRCCSSKSARIRQAWWGEVMLSYDRGRSFKTASACPRGSMARCARKPLLPPRRRRCSAPRRPSTATIGASTSSSSSRWRVAALRASQEQAFQVIQPTLLQPSRRPAAGALPAPSTAHHAELVGRWRAELEPAGEHRRCRTTTPASRH